MTHETHTTIDRIVRPGTLLMGAFLTAAFVDARWASGSAQPYDDRAQLISTDNDKDLSIIALVGNGANGHEYARQLGPRLAAYGSTHFVAYPSAGFSTESVADCILEAAEKDKDKRKAIYVSSMGEMVFNHLVADPEFAHALQPVDFLISNDGVTNISNVQPKILRLLHMGAHIPVTKTTATLYSAIKRNNVHKPFAHGPEVSDEQVREHLLATAATPLQALSAQWKAMLRYERLPDGTLEKFGRSILHKVHLNAPNDSVINGDASYRDKVALYGDFERVIDTTMPAGSHAMGVEFPGSITRILARRQVGEVSEPQPLAAVA